MPGQVSDFWGFEPLILAVVPETLPLSYVLKPFAVFLSWSCNLLSHSWHCSSLYQIFWNLYVCIQPQLLQHDHSKAGHPNHQPNVLYMILRKLLLLPVPALHQTGRQVPATDRAGTGQAWASLGGICFQDTM